MWLFTSNSTDKASYLDMLDRVDAMPVTGYLGGHNPITMTHEDLISYRRAAIEADYSKGIPFESFLEPEKMPRTCAVDGMTLEDMFRPGFAAVVIAPDWH